MDRAHEREISVKTLYAFRKTPFTTRGTQMHENSGVRMRTMCKARGAFIVHTLGLLMAFAIGSPAVALNDSQKPAPQEKKLLVLDIELKGDLGDPSLAPEHAARIKMASDQLREELGHTRYYEVVDATPARELIERLSSTQYLHQCNGCELDIARRVDADQVLVAWVHRVSNLILSLTYEIRDVQTGKPVWRVSFDLRGDNDKAWARAVSYLVRDLESRLAGG